MLVRNTERVFLFRIEDDDVGVGSDGDRSLLWKQPEHFRGSGRSELDKSIERNAILDDAGVNERDTMLDARGAIRDFGEVVAAQLLLLFHAEGTVVGRDDL